MLSLDFIFLFVRKETSEKTEDKNKVVKQEDKLKHKVHIRTTVYSMSPRPNWDPSHPLPRKRVVPTPGTKGGQTRLRIRGVGESQFRRLE
jgi:hypothetical protein